LALWSLDSLFCRQGGKRQKKGQVYEDVAAKLVAQAAAEAAAVGAAAPASSRAASSASQDPATASSGRPKRTRHQPQFFDGRPAATPGYESDESSNESDEYAASRRRKGQRRSMRTRSSARVQPSAQQVRSSHQQTECNLSTSRHPLPGVDKAEQDTLGSRQPTSSQNMFDSHRVRGWPDDGDGEGGQQVQTPSAEAVPVSDANAVSRHEERMQTNTVTDSEDEEPAAVHGGSQCTVYESDDDDDEDDAAEASLREAVLPAAAASPVLPAAAASPVLTAEAACAAVAASVTDPKMPPPMGKGSSVGQDQTAASGSAAKPAPVQLTLSALVSAVNARIAKEHAISLEQFPSFVTMEYLLMIPDIDIVGAMRETMPLIQPRQALNIGRCIMDFKQAL